MKGGLAAMLFATDALARRGPFPGRVVLAALVDEEGMMLGAKDLVARGRTDGVDAVICCEPEGGEICHVAKGALRLRLDFTGKMAHGAMPFEGRNPNRAAGCAIVALRDLEAALQARHGEHPYLGQVWITPTVLAAGTARADERDAGHGRGVGRRAHDPVGGPRRARRRAHRRSSPPRPASTASTSPSPRSTTVRRWPTPEDGPLVRAVWDAHASVTGTTPRLGGVPGSTDGTVITSRTGVPSVVYGPGGKWIAHQADEFVELADLVAHAEVYAEAAERFLRAGVAA